MDPRVLDDATHARDLVDHLDKHLGRLEAILDNRKHMSPTEMMERARNSAAQNRGRGLSIETPAAGWRPHPLHAKASGRPGTIDTITHGPDRRIARVTFADAPELKVIAHWAAKEDDPVAHYLELRRPLPVELELLPDRGVMHVEIDDVQSFGVHLLAVEVTEPGGPRTALPGLKVGVPPLPPGATPEMVEQHRQALLAASVYDHSDGAHNDAEAQAQDLSIAERNAGWSPAQARAGLSYTSPWSDNPRSTKPQPPPQPPSSPANTQKVCEALYALYVAAGIDVRAIEISGDSFCLVLPGRTIRTKLPEPLLKLLQESNDPSK